MQDAAILIYVFQVVFSKIFFAAAIRFRDWLKELVERRLVLPLH